MDLTAAGAPPGVHVVSIDRGDHVNSIDETTVERLHAELDAAEARPARRLLLIRSGAGVFSTGMDLAAAADAVDGRPPTGQAGSAYFDLLARFARTPVTVVCAVDGRVAGGGVGLVAASDLVIATGRSTFALPEALWGLLPCCVLPFLVRRTGFQRAYAMALTTLPVDAAEARAGGLVDEVTDDTVAAVRRVALRVSRIDRATTAALKRYAHGLWPLSDEVRQRAINELGRVMGLPAVQDRLADFAQDGRYPWER